MKIWSLLYENIDYKKFQWAKFSAMLGDVATQLKATDLSINSVGKTSEYADVQLETLSKKFEQLQQHLIGLANGAINGGISNFLKDVVDGTTHVVSGFEHMSASTIESSLAFLAVINLAPKLISSFEGIIKAIRSFELAEGSLSLLTGNLAGILTVAIPLALTAWADHVGNAIEKQEKLNTAIEDAKNKAPQYVDMYGKQAQALSDYARQLNNVNDQLNKSGNGNNSSLQNTRKSLIDAINSMVDYDTQKQLENAKYSNDAIDSVIKKLDEKKQKNQELIDQGQNEVVTVLNLVEQYKSLTETLKDSNTPQEEKVKAQTELADVTKELNILVPTFLGNSQKENNQVIELTNNYGKLTDKIKQSIIARETERQNNLKSDNEDLQSQMSSLQRDKKSINPIALVMSMGSQDKIVDLQNKIDENNKKIGESQSLIDAVNGKAAKTAQEMKSATLGAANQEQQIAENEKKRNEEVKQQIKDIEDATQNTDQTTLDGLKEKISLNGIYQESLVKVKDDFNKQTNDSVKSLDDLSNAYKTIQSGQQLSADQLLSLVQNNKELANYINQTNDVTFQQGDIIKQVTEARKQDTISALENQKAVLTASLQAIQAQIALKDVYQDNWAVGMQKSPEVQKLQDQAAAIQDMINGISASEKVISSKNIEDMTNKTQQLKTKQEELHNVMKSFDVELANNNSLMQNLVNWQKLYVEGSTDWLRVENQKIELMKEKGKLIDAQIKNQEAELKLLQQAPVSGDITTATGSNVSGSSLKSGILGGVFSGQEGLFARIAQQNGIDPGLLAAIAIFETGNGTSHAVNAYNNPGGLMNPSNTMELQRFPDLQSGLASMASNLARNYIKQGLTTIDQIARKYSPVGAENDPNGTNAEWPSNVKANYLKITGNNSSNFTSSGDTFFKTQAEKDSAILQVQQNLINLKGQSLDNQFSQQEEKLNKIIGTAGRYKVSIEDADKAQKAATETMAMSAKGTDEYNKAIDDQITQLRKKQDYAHQEAEYLRGQQNNSDLTSEQTRTIKNDIADLGTSFNQMQEEIAKLSMDKLTGIKDAVDEDNKAVETRISIIKNLADELKNANGENKAYRDELAKQVPLLSKQEDNQHKIAEAARDAIKSGTLNNEQMKQSQQIVDEATASYWQYFNSIHAVNEEIAKSKLDEVVTNTTNALDPLKGQSDLLNGQLDLLPKGDFADRRKLSDQLTSDYAKQYSTLQNSISQLQEHAKELSSTLGENSQAWKDNQKQLLDYQNQAVAVLKSQAQLKDSLYSQLSDILSQDETDYMQQLTDQHNASIKQMEDNLKNIQQSYDDQTKSLEDQLKLLDQQLTAQRQLKDLNKVNNEINAAMSDTSHAMIDSEGKLIYTYDKSKVKELEQKRADLLQQQATDAQKAEIQKKIDNLKDQKDQQTRILQEQIDDTKQQYQLQEQQEKDRWKQLQDAAKNGTLSFDNLMTGWFKGAIGGLQKFGIDAKKQIEQIKSIYASLGNIQLNTQQIMNPGVASSGGSSSGNSTLDMLGQKYNEAMAKGDTQSAAYYHQVANEYRQANGMSTYYDSNTDKGGSSSSNKSTSSNSSSSVQPSGTYNADGSFTPSKFHDGGIVGSDLERHHDGNFVSGKQPSRLSKLVNAFLNKGLGSNEQAIVALKGELYASDRNISQNFIPNMQKLVGSIVPGGSVQSVDQSHHYNISGVTVQANDALSFMDSINHLVRARTT